MKVSITIFDLSEIMGYVINRYSLTRDEAMEYIDLILYAKYESIKSKRIMRVYDPDYNFTCTDTTLIEFVEDTLSTIHTGDYSRPLDIAKDIEYVVNGTVLRNFWDEMDSYDNSLERFERIWRGRSDLIIEVS